MSDNVIEVDFAKRTDAAEIAALIREALVPTLTEVAERRGYNPARVEQIASIMGETVKAMDRPITFTVTLPSTNSPEEMQKWAEEFATQLAQRVTRQCLLAFTQAIPALCYPPQ